jgi:hypothetical protein
MFLEKFQDREYSGCWMIHCELFLIRTASDLIADYHPGVQTVDIAVHDFDFLIGEWSVRNRRLKVRFANSDHWDEFPAKAYMHTVLAGAGNLEEIHFPTQGHTGLTLRLFNRQSKQWFLYWATDREGVLQPPVVGRFENGTGEFYGDDVDDGRPIRVRYVWSKITPSSAQWEQAFSLDHGQSWETNWIMEFTRIGKAVPACCPIVELRQYAMKPGRRDDLIALFEEHFIDAQEEHGMTVIGQFRNLKDPDRFVWLRGFADMEARRRALDGFYNGPIWMEHRVAANDTMLDSSNVLLLRPARFGSSIALGAGERPSANGQTECVVIAVVYSLGALGQADFADFFETTVAPRLRSAGATFLGQFETAGVENTFPRLPVREGEFVFVWLASFADYTAYRSYEKTLEEDPLWNDSVGPALNERVPKPAEILELAPASRSFLRHR